MGGGIPPWYVGPAVESLLMRKKHDRHMDVGR